MVTDTGRDLAAALAELLRVPADDVHTTYAGGGYMRHEAVTWSGAVNGRRVTVTLSAHTQPAYYLRVSDAAGELAEGTGQTPAAARDDALARLAAGADRVRAALGAEADEWAEGPPSEDGWYAVEGEPAPRWFERGILMSIGFGFPYPAWPAVAGRPARYRRLDLPAPPPRTP